MGFLLKLTRHRRTLIFFLHFLIAAGSYTAAFLVRFDGVLPFAEWQNYSHLVLYAVLFKMLAMYRFQLYQGYWRYVSTYDLIRIIKACTASSLALVALWVFLGPEMGVRGFPRGVFLLDWLISIFAFGGVRLLVRLFREAVEAGLTETAGRRTLIVGAGDTGETALRELRKHFGAQYNVVGFVDDDGDKRGMILHGVKVIGGTADVGRLAREKGVEEVLFAIPSASKRLYRGIVEQCEGVPVRFRILPSLADLISGRFKPHQMRQVSVEDLLGRDPVSLDRQRVERDLEGTCVLITGAGGSIGSELARQIATARPSRIILFDIAETPLFEVDRQLGELFPRLPRELVLGDIMIRERVERVFEQFRPQRVFHAAAYKHVPMMEKHPLDAVRNNVTGTRHVAEAAIRFGAGKFVLISSDKAVHPRNVMGATKRCAELLLASLDPGPTAFIAVRFGNVLGSNGSVVPIFRQQINAGGPVRVTHPEATRFFMTIPEAVELVLQASVIGRGGEVFLLDMGDPVSIVQLARNMIELSGLRPGDDIEIEYTGLRPGEKLHEELVIAGENVRPTEVPKVLVHVRGALDRESVAAGLAALEASAAQGDAEATDRALFALVEATREEPAGKGCNR